MTVPNDPRDPAWGLPALPEKITAFRPAQLQAIDEILWRFQFGAKYVVLDAPTGSGKTLVAEAVRRLFTRSMGGTLPVKGLYMCVDRGLQRQFQRDFDYAETVMGRANYPTLDFPERFEGPERLSCDDCTSGQGKKLVGKQRSGCDWCRSKDLCPYLVAKREALAAPLACVNTSYFLHEANGPGAFSDWPLIIADEGDRLEDQLMAYAEVKLGKRRLADWGLLPTGFDAGQPPVEQVVEWLDRASDEAARDLQRLVQASVELTLQERREKRRLENLIDRLESLKDDYPKGNWVVQSGEDSPVVFKPVKVDGVGQGLLWGHAQQWLIMSATVLDAGRMLRDLGVHDSWAVVQMPSSFPVANRPIYARPAADVTAKNMPVAVPLVAEAVAKIIDAHPKERILVHTVSYRMAGELKRLLPDTSRCHWLESSELREEVLGQYLARPDAVLIAPALERGLDLPDDACRVVVICKVPYPDLGDPQVNARFNLLGGRDWYMGRTLRSLVQMTGRGVRHEQDWCVTYILDEQIRRVLDRNASRLPAWWLEAVQWS